MIYIVFDPIYQSLEAKAVQLQSARDFNLSPDDRIIGWIVLTAWVAVFPIDPFHHSTS